MWEMGISGDETIPAEEGGYIWHLGNKNVRRKQKRFGNRTKFFYI
jgi:hypothetical protein